MLNFFKENKTKNNTQSAENPLEDRNDKIINQKGAIRHCAEIKFQIKFVRIVACAQPPSQQSNYDRY
jgi:hypothetical protein